MCVPFDTHCSLQSLWSLFQTWACRFLFLMQSHSGSALNINYSTTTTTWTMSSSLLLHLFMSLYICLYLYTQYKRSYLKSYFYSAFKIISNCYLCFVYTFDWTSISLHILFYLLIFSLFLKLYYLFNYLQMSPSHVDVLYILYIMIYVHQLDEEPNLIILYFLDMNELTYLSQLTVLYQNQRWVCYPHNQSHTERA